MSNEIPENLQSRVNNAHARTRMTINGIYRTADYYLAFSPFSISGMWKGIDYFSYTENSIPMIFYSDQTQIYLHTQFYVLFYLRKSYYIL